MAAAAAGTAEVINHLISICPHQTRSLPTHTWPTPASPALAGGVETMGRGSFMKTEREREKGSRWKRAGGVDLNYEKYNSLHVQLSWCTSPYSELVMVMRMFNSWLYARTHTRTHKH